MKGGGPRRIAANAGRMPVQLRFHTGLTDAEYVTAQAWRLASMAGCPEHARGGCGFARHGTYERKTPAGPLIARWYCPQGHRTFSLLPDHLAARFGGTLAQIEQVVLAVECAPSVQAAADRLRPDAVTLPSAIRWVRRRLAPVRALLTTVVGLLPDSLSGCAATISALRERLACDHVLRELRQMAASHLQALAAPLGFRGHRIAAPSSAGGERKRRRQQPMGPDPPIGAR